MILRNIWGSCAICVILTIPAAATQMQGEQRAEAIKTTASSCLDRSVKQQENRPYTLAAVDAYCTCFGTAIVDGFSMEELAAASDGMTPAMAKRREGLVNTCASRNLGKAQK